VMGSTGSDNVNVEVLRRYFGQRFHIITARKKHQCKICKGEISPNEKCVRIFKPVIVGVKKPSWKGGKLGLHYQRERRGWIQVFYHIPCVENEVFKLKLKREQIKRRIREVCPKCPNYVDGYCLRKIGNILYVNHFCEKVR